MLMIKKINYQWHKDNVYKAIVSMLLLVNQLFGIIGGYDFSLYQDQIIFSCIQCFLSVFFPFFFFFILGDFLLLLFPGRGGKRNITAHCFTGKRKRKKKLYTYDYHISDLEKNHDHWEKPSN